MGAFRAARDHVVIMLEADRDPAAGVGQLARLAWRCCLPPIADGVAGSDPATPSGARQVSRR
ncbi:MAG: hypothetical protein ACLPQY_13715 [Streptosporangiaceae bacterium]